MNNNGDNEWPPKLLQGVGGEPKNRKEAKEQTSGSQMFDFISKLIVNIVGWGVAAALAAVFIRLVLYILGVYQ